VGTANSFVSYGVAVDTEGSLYVFELSNNRICKYDADGDFLTAWSGSRREGAFSMAGLAVDQQGDLYVAEPFDNLVLKFRQHASFARSLEASRAATSRRSLNRLLLSESERASAGFVDAALRSCIGAWCREIVE
jgi:streptogramin lyase